MNLDPSESKAATSSTAEVETGQLFAETHPNTDRRRTATLAALANRLWQSLMIMPAVLVSPRRAFRSMESSRPFLLALLIGGVSLYFHAASLSRWVGIDTLFLLSIEKEPEFRAYPTIVDALKRNYIIFHPYAMIAIPFLWALTLVIIATILYELDHRFFNNHRSYSHILSIVTYAQAPGILLCLLVCALLWIHHPLSGINLDALSGLNLGLLFPWTTDPPFCRYLFNSLDLLTIWSLLLIALGLSSQQAALSKTLSYVATMWCLYILAESSVLTMYLHMNLTSLSALGVGK